MYNDDDIVISGVSGRYPNADSIEELWNLLLSGVNLASPEKLWPTGESGFLPVPGSCYYPLTQFTYFL
ncbi:hypothetical protein B4U80_14899 [Leptotrombidium deliense]|uniref:Beta-ketoacyl synthase-like N-terminal domain-containing protein n=1 Tax=Leptotrombidium deliense TaxID=299467 RepID=A0A443S4B6_9ACAR|nr:hypothetical protein B4U80_14899 [Leptotrombidium deliense]